MRLKLGVIASAVGMCMLCSLSIGWGQGNQGAITGTVLDASGAIVPGVSITVTDINRGLKYSMTSTSAGVFVTPSMTVGQYRVEAEKQGFKKYIQEPVTVNTGSVTTVNVTLEVGAVTQQVQVMGSNELLQTTDAAANNLETGKMYEDLPLTMATSPVYGTGRRRAEQFILTQPGVNTGVEGDVLGKTFNGSQYYSGAVLIDGVSVPNSLNGGQIEMAEPPYAAMAEYTVQTSNMPAEYGGGSGIENLTFKSGTNVYHGNLFGFHRDDQLNARGFTPTPKRGLFIQNDDGGAIGGPIIVPHVYNGRNRSFFYGTMEYFKQSGGPASTPTYTVPTQAERQGDFSALLQPANGGIVIYDPSTTTLCPAPVAWCNGVAAGKYARSPFPNNNITLNHAGQPDIVTQGTYWQKWIQAPNITGTNGGLFNNFKDIQYSDTHEYIWSAKVDHTFNDRHRIAWSYWGDEVDSIGVSDFYFDIPPSPGSNHGGGHRLHDYYTISANMQNDVHLGYTQYGGGSVCSSGAKLGPNPANVPNLLLYNPGGTGQVRWGGNSQVVYFRGGAAIAGCVDLGGGKVRGQPREVSQVGDIIDWVHGSHDLKFGLDGWLEYNTDREVAGGWWTFQGLETGQPGVTLGDSFASSELGLADSSTIAGPNIGVQYHDPRMGAFMQDIWKVTRKFTINYGLRWDRPWQTTETYNRMSGFNWATPNPAAGNIPGAMVFLGSGAGRTGTSTFPGVHASNREFAPRLAFAYALNSKTVIRAGYAIEWTYGNGDAIGFDEGGSPWQQGIAKFAANLSSPDNGITPGDNLAVGLPVPNCTLPCINPSFANGGTPMFWDPNAGREPYIQQWTFGVQHYFPGGFFLNASYIGNKGTRLTFNGDNWNQLPVSDMTTYGNILTEPYNSADAIAAGVKSPYAGFTGTAGQALRAFPQYSAIADRFDPLGMNRYDSLQMSLRKQMGDLQLMVNFTAEKNLSDSGPGAFNGTFAPAAAEDTHNFRLEKAVLSYTAPKRVVASWLWSLPVGKGKRYASAAHGIENQLLGGWQVGAIQTYRDGYPDAVSGGNPNPIFNTASRPNELAGVPVRTQGCNNINLGKTVLANINAFAKNNSLQLGTAPRILPAFRGCAWLDEDFTTQKQFPITERVHLEFRADFYNVFNRHKFSDPSLSVASPATFGTIGSVDGQFQPRITQFGMKLIW